MSNSNQGGTVVVIAAILLVLFLGVAVLGVGGLFFYRTTALRREVAAVEVARAHEAAARHASEVAQERLLEQSLPSSDFDRPSITIELDGDGNLTVNGEPVSTDDLKPRLSDHVSGGRRPVVSIHASPDCEFRHLARVMNDCQQVGVEPVISTDD